MIRAAAALTLAGAACAADLMHVPIACRYWPESHFVAGAVVGLAMNEWMDTAAPEERLPLIGRFIFATAAAAGVGMIKEAFIDKNPRAKEIPPWALGAATVTLAWEITW